MGQKFGPSKIFNLNVDTNEKGEQPAQLLGEQMQTTFDLERYLNNSQKIETRDLDFSRAGEYPLTSEEIRCLTYMMDVESHTIIYMKGLLRTCAVNDPDVMAFLSCWAYEEFFHGRAIRQFLQASGVPIDSHRADEVRRGRSWRERLE